MPVRKCLICNSDFIAKQYFIDRGQGKYCSKPCQYVGFKKGKAAECFSCKKVIYRSLSDIRKSKSQLFFCDKSCQTLWRNKQYVGEKHINWRGGARTYRDILRRKGDPVRCTLCLITDQRVLAAHHVDHNHGNNEPENLVWLCHNCHYLVHHDKLIERKLMVIMV